MKALYFLPIAVLLAGCGAKGELRTEEPIIVTKEVAVAVDAPCVPDDLASPPIYVDTKEALLAVGDAIDERLKLLYAGRAQREARLNEVEPVVAGCPRGKVAKK